MPSTRHIALITIGQSPRDDVVPDIRRRLPQGLDVIEAGALDGLDRSEIARLAPKAPGEALVTRLRDGSQVVIGKPAILGRLQAILDRLADEVEASVILCTGAFPTLKSPKPLLEPDRILKSAVTAVHRDGTLGIIIPLKEQEGWTRATFADTTERLAIAVASPYLAPEALAEAARGLKREGARLVALNCMGFSEAQKAIVRRESGAPVLQPASLLGKLIDEVVA